MLIKNHLHINFSQSVTVPFASLLVFMLGNIFHFKSFAIHWHFSKAVHSTFFIVATKDNQLWYLKNLLTYFCGSDTRFFVPFEAQLTRTHPVRPATWPYNITEYHLRDLNRPMDLLFMYRVFKGEIRILLPFNRYSLYRTRKKRNSTKSLKNKLIVRFCGCAIVQ